MRRAIIIALGAILLGGTAFGQATSTPLPTGTPTNTPTPTQNPTVVSAHGQKNFTGARHQIITQHAGSVGTWPLIPAPTPGSRIYLFGVEGGTSAATTGGLTAGGLLLVPLDAAGAATFPSRHYENLPLGLPAGVGLDLTQSTGSGRVDVTVDAVVGP